MLLEEFIEKKLFIDIRSLGLDTIHFGEDMSKSCGKFLKILKEINEKKGAFIIEKEKSLKLYSAEGTPLSVDGLDRKYKEKLISTNVFTQDEHDSSMFVKNNNAENYIMILTESYPSKSCSVKIGNESFILTGVSHDKTSRLKERVISKGNQCIIKIPRHILSSYYIYETLNSYYNSFFIKIPSGKHLPCCLLEDGLYLM